MPEPELPPAPLEDGIPDELGDIGEIDPELLDEEGKSKTEWLILFGGGALVLVSLLLLGATIGTAVSPLVTSQIVDWTSNHTILIFGSACYGVLMLLLFAALRLTRS